MAEFGENSPANRIQAASVSEDDDVVILDVVPAPAVVIMVPDSPIKKRLEYVEETDPHLTPPRKSFAEADDDNSPHSIDVRRHAVRRYFSLVGKGTSP